MLQDTFHSLLGRVAAALEGGAGRDDGGLLDAITHSCDMARRGLLDELARRGEGFVPPASRPDAPSYLEQLTAAAPSPAATLARVATMAVAAVEVGVADSGTDPFHYRVLDTLREPLTGVTYALLLALSEPGSDATRVVDAETAVGYVLAADLVADAFEAATLFLLRDATSAAGAADVALAALGAAQTVDEHPGGCEILAGLAAGWVGTLDELVDATIGLAGDTAAAAAEISAR